MGLLLDVYYDGARKSGCREIQRHSFPSYDDDYGQVDSQPVNCLGNGEFRQRRLFEAFRFSGLLSASGREYSWLSRAGCGSYRALVRLGL